MAKLSELGVVVKGKTPVIFVSFEETNALTSDGQPYVLGKLLNPVVVISSMVDDPELKVLEVDELFIRQDDVDADVWEKTEDGYKIRHDIKGWRADFTYGTLKSDAPVIFQHGSIREWVKDQRKTDREEFVAKRREDASLVVERMKERRKKQ